MADTYAELLKIREEHGKLTPRIVRDAVRPKTHPLHEKVYDMTVKEAAEAHYLANAAKLLRVTFRETVDGRPADLRHFWVVRGTTENPESTYEPMSEVIQDPVSRQVMLRQMMRDWQRFKARYKTYTEFVEMVLNDPDFIDADEEFGNNGSEG